jgi:hypothetical protein
MKIRIIRVIGEEYKEILGCVFEVIGKSTTQYYINHKGIDLFIQINNAEVVEEVENRCSNCKFNELYGKGHNCDATFTDDYLPQCKKWQPIEPAMRETADPSKIISGTEQRRMLTEREAMGTVTIDNVEDIKLEIGSAQEAKHYMTGEYQPILIMQDKLTNDQFIGYLLGNVIKYSLRLNHKNQSRSDAGKCSQYAYWLCLAMDGEIIELGDK